MANDTIVNAQPLPLTSGDAVMLAVGNSSSAMNLYYYTTASYSLTSVATVSAAELLPQISQTSLNGALFTGSDGSYKFSISPSADSYSSLFFYVLRSLLFSPVDWALGDYVSPMSSFGITDMALDYAFDGSSLTVSVTLSYTYSSTTYAPELTYVFSDFG